MPGIFRYLHKNICFIIPLILLLAGCTLPEPLGWDGNVGGGGINETSVLFNEESGPGGRSIYRFYTNEVSFSQPFGRNFWLPRPSSYAEPFNEYAVRVNKRSGAAEGGFGLVLCHGRDAENVESMLTVMIRTDGYYQIAEVVGTSYTPFSDWHYSTHIHTGKGFDNELKIKRDSDDFVLYINGHEVERFSDNTEAPIHVGGTQGFLSVVTPLEQFPQFPVEVTFEEVLP